MSQEERTQDHLTLRLDRLDSLPPRSTTRWVKSRKLAVIQAIREGKLTEEEACAYYDLSPEELDSWARMVDRHGPDALRATHLRRYRNKDIESGTLSLQD